MIIPNISLREFAADPPDDQRLIALIRHWSFLNTIALSDVENFPRARLEKIVQSVGGAVEVYIQLKTDELDFAIAVLNAGATKLIGITEWASSFSTLPEDSWSLIHSVDSNLLPRGALVEITDPTAAQLAALERDGVDALVSVDQLASQPNMIAEFFQMLLISDRPDGLWPTILVDPLGLVLGLVYSNYESLLDAITNRRGTYWSRSRNELWIKGASSGATQTLVGIRLDCDRDCLRFEVTQASPGFCHLGTHSCFGRERNGVAVTERLLERISANDEQSFTKKLVNDPAMLRLKLVEDAGELADATTPEEVAFEAADVWYFSLVKMLSNGVRVEQVWQELSRRMTRVVRRKNKLER